MSYQKLYLKRAVKVAKLVSQIPFVRAIFLTGSVSRGQAKQKSDIDFFIVTKPNRIWTCRALVTLFVHLIGKRRHGNKIAGRICLNRYQNENYLEIKPCNQYHKQDYSQITPLYDPENIYKKYQKANGWIGKFSIKYKEVRIMAGRNPMQKALETILNTKFGDLIEKSLAKYQKKRIMRDPQTKKSKSWQIIANNRELSFHPQKSK